MKASNRMIVLLVVMIMLVGCRSSGGIPQPTPEEMLAISLEVFPRYLPIMACLGMPIVLLGMLIFRRVK